MHEILKHLVHLRIFTWNPPLHQKGIGILWEGWKMFCPYLLLIGWAVEGIECHGPKLKAWLVKKSQAQI
jgi:hypothetical protein